MNRFATLSLALTALAVGGCASDGQQQQSTQTASASQPAGRNATPGTPPDGAMTGEEIQQAYSDQTYYGRTPSGRVFILEYSADGGIHGKVRREQDRGRWWVQGNQICRNWDRWAERKPEECFFVVPTRTHMRWYSNDGTLYRAWSRRPGG